MYFSLKRRQTSNPLTHRIDRRLFLKTTSITAALGIGAATVGGSGALAAEPLPANLEAEIARGAAAVLPLSAADLELEGPALGRALKAAEAAWIASDFALTAGELRRSTLD